MQRDKATDVLAFPGQAGAGGAQHTRPSQKEGEWSVIVLPGESWQRLAPLFTMGQAAD